MPVTISYDLQGEDVNARTYIHTEHTGAIRLDQAWGERFSL